MTGFKLVRTAKAYAGLRWAKVTKTRPDSSGDDAHDHTLVILFLQLPFPAGYVK